MGRSELLADAHLLLDDVARLEDHRVEDAEDGEGATDDGAQVDEELGEWLVGGGDAHLQGEEGGGGRGGEEREVSRER